MDPKVRELLNKVKEGAVTYGKVAGKLASDAAEKARLNLQLFDLNTEIDISYKEIGKLVYAMHAGEEVSNEAVQKQIDAIELRKASIAEIRAKLASFKSTDAPAAEPCGCCDCGCEDDAHCDCGCEGDAHCDCGCEDDAHCDCGCEDDKAESGDGAENQ